MTHKRRTWWRILATLVAFTLISSACGGDRDGDSATGTTLPPDGLIGGSDDDDDEAASEVQYGGSIVVALEAETDNWLPGAGQLTVTSAISASRTFYDPLTMLNGDDEVVPFLAESVEPNDDLDTWTVTLRPGVEFHDGTPLDAETVVWNFDTLHNIEGSNTSGAIADHRIEEVEAVDDLTVVYHLSGPNAAFPSALRNSLGLPVSRQAYEEMGRDAFMENPVGTGPFVFQQWTRDDRLVVTRNDNYWRTDDDGNQLPYLDEIEFRPIPDENSRHQSLAADSVQVMVTLRGSSGRQVIELAEERNYRAEVTITNTSGASIFNTQRPPVDDVRVRKALVAASDGAAVAVVLGDDGLGVPPTNQFFAPDNQWYSELAAAAYPAADGPDFELADELMLDYINDPDRSDGRAPGDRVEIEYACPPDPSLIEIGQLYQNDWGGIAGGMVDVNLRQVEQPELIGNAISGDYMINCWRAGADEGDPLITLQSFFSDPETNPLNFTNYTNPEIDELLEVLRTEIDFEVRYEAAERINVIANEESLNTWSIATPHVAGWRDDIRGLTSWVLPNGDPGRGTKAAILDFSQVWMG